MTTKKLNVNKKENKRQQRIEKIFFLGNGRCYHTISWLRNIILNKPSSVITFITDRTGSPISLLVNKFPGVNVNKMIDLNMIINDSFSRFSNLYRNIVSLIVLPAQAIKLRFILRNEKRYVIHSHCLYYAFIAYMARVKCVVTPQGSEILVRPYKSKLYKLISKKILNFHGTVTVDSIAMKNACIELYGVKPIVVQNGINVADIINKNDTKISRKKVTSIRGCTPLYQIDEIIKAINFMTEKIDLNYVFPFSDSNYLDHLKNSITDNDVILGRLSHGALYRLLNESLLVISIPKSDSSPRSVYESIFCGAAVAVSDLIWIDMLPTDMRERLIVVDLNDPRWLEYAIKKAKKITEHSYCPSEESLGMFDELETAKTLINCVYPGSFYD